MNLLPKLDARQVNPDVPAWDLFNRWDEWVGTVTNFPGEGFKASVRMYEGCDPTTVSGDFYDECLNIASLVYGES